MQVEIIHAELEQGRPRRERVPTLARLGPWAVTPSRDAEVVGVVVTHVPSGRQAWPTEPGKVLLPRAVQVMRQLHDLHPGEESLTRRQRRDLCAFIEATPT